MIVPPCSRRHAFGVLAAGVLAIVMRGVPPLTRPGRLWQREALSVEAIVRLHLEHAARCAGATARRAAAIGPPALAAAQRQPRATGPHAARTAFALLEHFGEFPPVHRPFGGLQ
ncbi:MAG TPA: hypothetical protein VFM14_05595 [Gemmatimonadales bacterium]|nr:hypothetical protein [Gemmatimonadales bacterium]